MKKWLAGGLIVIIFLFQNWNGYSAGRLQVTYLDIGQGDATLIQTPDGFLALVDAGPDDLTVERLSEFLAFNTRKIDLMIITHFDADHIGGLPEIQSSYEIRAVVYNTRDPNLKPQIRNLIEKIPGFLDVFTNRKMQLGCCVSLEFIWPVDPSQIFKDANMASLTFILDYQEINFFFSGDLPKEYEVLLLNRIPKITIFKVGHHGSYTSTARELLEKITPKLAVISAGAGNKYGHPHKQVLILLTELGIPILRTDQSGSINIITDGYVFQTT